jgi:hypothetical protein
MYHLRTNPVMVYSLDTYLANWVADHEKELEANNNLTLDEILTQHLRIRSNDKQIDHEIINAADKVWNAATSGSFHIHHSKLKDSLSQGLQDIQYFCCSAISHCMVHIFYCPFYNLTFLRPISSINIYISIFEQADMLMHIYITNPTILES